MRALVAALLGILFLTTAATAADVRPAPDRLDWETGDGKSYWIPALEVTGFIFSLNAINRGLFGRDYDSNFDTVGRNLRTAPVYDKDPFSVNQIGHPYQGSIYYGFARSAGIVTA